MTTDHFAPSKELLDAEQRRQRERAQLAHPSTEWMLYALKLEHEKYYIGRAYDVLRRYQGHVAGTGSQWTSLHPPIDLIESKRIESSLKHKPDLAESKLTIEYMARYGWRNVRGGDFTVVDDAVIERKLVDSGLMAVITSIQLSMPHSGRRQITYPKVRTL